MLAVSFSFIHFAEEILALKIPFFAWILIIEILIIQICV